MIVGFNTNDRNDDDEDNYQNNDDNNNNQVTSDNGKVNITSVVIFVTNVCT